MGNKLNILHIGNLAGVADIISKELKRRGHNSYVISYNAHCKVFPGDKSYYILDHFPLNLFRVLVLILMTFPKYDIYHFHSRSLLPKYFDLLFYKLIHRKVILHFHGSDIRGKKCPYFIKYASKIIVATPDLIEWVPNATLILNPISLAQYQLENTNIKDESTQDTKITIVHAPTNRTIKGTNNIIYSIDELHKNGYNIDFKILENIPHSKLMDEFKKADIIVDQLILDWYGMVSIEGMTLGIPVCTHIGGQLESYIPSNAIAYCDANNLTEVLTKLINEPNLRRCLANNGRKYVEQNHDVRAIVDKLINMYEN